MDVELVEYYFGCFVFFVVGNGGGNVLFYDLVVEEQ